MSVTKGMFANQARKLLDLARSANEICNVKTVDKDIRSKPGRAILLDVINDSTARIKPFKHGGKEEIVKLTTLRFWKGGCNFNIEEAVSMIETPRIQSSSTHGSRILSEPIVLLSRKFGHVWGGEQRRWTTNIATAHVWYDKSQTVKTVERLSKIPSTDDVEAVTRDVAFDFLSQKKKATREVPEIPQSIAEISAAHKASPPTLPVYSTEDSDDELSAMLNLDPNALLKASEDVKKAHKDCQTAELVLKEARQRLESAKNSYRNVLSQMGVPTAPSAKKKKQASAGQPKGFLRDAVNTVLFNHSKLDMKTIVDKVMATVPTTTSGSVKQSLYTLRASGVVSCDEDRHWMMTEAGRKAYIK